MIGGLFKSTSRVAMVAAAGLLSGGVAAQAADLGGNCCADLEERVAELEATTARKGNTKVSLTISGNISQHVIYWDDNHESNAYVGSDDNRVTRFRFKGGASINADVSAGFNMEFGLSGGSNTSQAGDPAVDDLLIRQSYVFIKSKSYGTLSLGHQSDATDGIRSICLGCTADVSASSSTMVSALNVNVEGGAYGPTWGNLGTGNVADGGRRNLVKYVSPTVAGFHVSAAWGDDDFYDAALRYVGEFGAIRLAAGIGYANAVGDNGDDTEYVSGSVSASHVPTGIYVAFAMSETENGADRTANRAAGVNRDTTDTQWFVGAGIKTKLNSLGASTFSVGYGHSDEGFVGGGTVATAGTVGLPIAGSGWSTADTEHWSVGFQQDIDAAAMQLFISYGHLSGDITNGFNGVSSAIEDAQYVNAGMNIKF